jgi:hypothetical protein
VAVESVPAKDADQVARTYVAPLPDGPLLCLEGTGALIWREALAARPSTVAIRVADAVGLPADEIRPDVDRLLAELVERGLLVPVANPDLADGAQPD